ncbi:MAG: metallophosphoesterase [Planctomycetota bacterium]
MYRRHFCFDMIARVLSAMAAIGCIFCALCHAHENHHSSADADLVDLVNEWVFRPNYALPRRAAHPRVGFSAADNLADPEFARDSLPLRLMGLSPTERFRNLVPTADVPRQEFTFEAWINNHVDQPVGFAAVAGGSSSPQDSGWAIAYHSFPEGQSRAVAKLVTRQGETVELACDHDRSLGFQEYWWHLVLTFDGETCRMYLNGKQQAEASVGSDGIAWPATPQFEIAAYLEQEPQMQLANLLNHARLYRRAISTKEIQQRFAEFKYDLEEGLVRPGFFHFTVSPYLNYATQHSIRVLWETDTPAAAKVEWGPTAELGNSQLLEEPKRIQEYEITDLEPQTPYFYRVTAINADQEGLSSGILTFQTAVRAEAPFRFVVIGDTETRPHINHELSKKVWGERPNFVVVLGDLTDGGKRDAKWQWSHEYFTGIAGLGGRVPFYPVPGNGEGDLYWYKRYHSLPGDESPYSFTYGNAEFFMLDSNRKAIEFPPGGRQHLWLEDKLENSRADWKFVCFHHAPFSSDEDDYGNAWLEKPNGGDDEVRQLVPLFEKYGVDVVMFGHIHSYERSRRISTTSTDKNGVLYLLCGGGGGNLEDFAPNPTNFSSKVSRGHHYVLINIENQKLDLRMHDLSGGLADVTSIDKGQAQP